MAGGKSQIFQSRRSGPLARPRSFPPPVPPTSARGISTQPSAAYSCFDPCPDGASEQVGEYIPYLFSPFYKRFTVPARGVDSLLNICIPQWQGGYCKTWWFVKCFGYDVVRDTTDEDAPALPADVFPEGIPYSMLKLEVIGTEYGKFKARFLFDIGSRIDVNLGAYQRLEAYVQVPDLQAYRDNGGYLDPNVPYNLQDFRAKSLILPSAVGVEALGGFRNGRFTQSLYLSAADQPTQTMDIPAGSKQVHVMSDDPATAQTLTFLSPMSLPVSVVLGTSNSVIEIPDNADRVMVGLAGGDAGPRIATLIFRLDV